MFVKKIAVWLVCLALLLPGVVRADVAAAKAAYMRGMAQQKAKQYQAAIYEYEASLQAEPRYAYSYKQMGTCYYYMGDKVKAVESYDKYLVAVPNDAPIRKFADSIRGQAGTGVSQARSLPKWGIGLATGFNTYGMADWNAAYGDSGSSSTYSYKGATMGGGLGMGTKVRYRITPNWEAALNIGYLMSSSSSTSSSTYNNYSSKIDYSLSALWIGPQGSFILPDVVKNLNISFGLELGYLTLMGAGYTGSSTSSSSTSSGTGTYAGSGFGGKISSGADWFFSKNFSLGVDLGYRMASIGKVEEAYSYSGGGGSGSGSDTLTKAYPSEENLPLDYSGVAIGLGLTFWL